MALGKLQPVVARQAALCPYCQTNSTGWYRRTQGLPSAGNE
jgi:hypothetical protein